MSSNINPNNIDGTYPVAGQDNDSQGFRDNFTNTKTNFQYAKDEITDLQEKVVLKAPLTGGTLNNNMNNSVISNVQLLNTSAPRLALGSVTEVVMNLAASPYYTASTAGSVTLSFTNVPIAGQVARARLQLTVTNTSYTLTLPNSVSVGVSNLQGYSNNVITFNRTGIYEFEFSTSDNGTTFSIFDLNRNHDPIYLPSAENLTFVANVANVSLNTTATYFSTGNASTGSLAAGSAGQIKTIMAANVASGNYTLTVANAGWQESGTGTIVFASRGAAVTLQYVNSKWYAVGNNGVTFG